MAMQAPFQIDRARSDRIDMTHSPLTLEGLKRQAKSLRADMAADGTKISHSRALELVAHQLGYKDWNTLHAKLGNRTGCPVWLGQTVAGKYLGQAFIAEVIGVQTLPGNRFRINLDFDEAVDVVTFDSFSNFRKRVHCVITPDGVTEAKTSNGQPHLVLEL
jgi:hypothetical protein